ncbi:hypothetical protein [Burkholderia cenocepacia]|uniref:hypothetical protein n=1 Tax=Burkholderia cenocepacia TaxID=95486 RepID=UPI000F59C865|nr:hypothetical protein [Burkholderia cenocepacia]
MKKLLYIIFFFIIQFFHPAWAQTCNNASLNGKYVISGQGDAFNACILGLVCLGHATVSSTGYIVADGNGNITSARLFQAINSGVQDTGIVSNAGTYSITDCDNGALKLIFNGGVSTYNVDIGNIDPAGVAHSGVVLDADPGYDESFQLIRTVDPTGANACGGGLSLNGISVDGIEQGHDSVGNPVSAIVSMTLGGGNLFGSERKASQNGFIASPITGTYVINPDCSILLTRTINGITMAGAHVVTGIDPAAPDLQTVVVWQGDTVERVMYRSGKSQNVQPVIEEVRTIPYF